jgi:O-antigen/teichoic acid export membrane protein
VTQTSDQGLLPDPPATTPPDEGPPAGRPSVKEGFSFAATSFAVNVVVGLLSALLTARVYGVDVIGQYAITTAPWLTVIQFSSVAEQVALTRKVSVLPAHHRMVAGLFMPILLFSIGLTVVAGIPIMLLSAAAMRGPIHQPQLVLPALSIVVGYCVIDNTSWNIDAVLSGFRAGRELFYARLVQVGGFLVLALAFSTVSHSIWAMTLATIASFVVSLAVRVVLLKRFTRFFPDRTSLREGFRELPEMLRFAIRVVGGRIAGGLNSQADTWILGSLVPVALVGAYARASGLAVRMNDAGYRVNEILFPTLTERHEAGDQEGFEGILLRSIRMTALPLAIAAGAGGGAAVGILGMFGPGFSRGAGALAFLLLAYSLTVIAMIQGGALLAVGRPSWSTWIAVVRLFVSVPLMFVLAHFFEATGVAAALFVGCAIVGVQAAWYLRRAALSPGSTPEQLRTLGVVVLVYAVAFGVSRLIDQALPGVLGAGIAVGAGALAAMPVVLCLPGGISAGERRAVLLRVRQLRRR